MVMKRIHLHVSVPNLAQSIRFYATLFGAPPTVEKADYAKWMLEDPRVNFAISQRGAARGIDHIGVQAETADELSELSGRLKAADIQTFDEQGAHCCYAQGDKSWVTDPAGVRWETFFTFGEATTYGEDSSRSEPDAGACCGAQPASAAKACC